jgi:copper chaperone
MATSILNVPDVSCEHCEHTITTALQPLAGVRRVRVDIPAHLVTVDYDETQVTIHRLKDILREEDYPVESVA